MHEFHIGTSNPCETLCLLCGSPCITPGVKYQVKAIINIDLQLSYRNCTQRAAEETQRATELYNIYIRYDHYAPESFFLVKDHYLVKQVLLAGHQCFSILGKFEQ